MAHNSYTAPPSVFHSRVANASDPDNACWPGASAAQTKAASKRGHATGPVRDHEDDEVDSDAVASPAQPPDPPSISRAKEKRKRSRVTPEQLLHLEALFVVDRNPTAARRRDIGLSLGMHERQTQIWYQNRRAKAKLLDGKQKENHAPMPVPPDVPPQLSPGFEVDLHNLLHEDEAVTIIASSDLSIGSWRRVASAVSKSDLVAYVCEQKRRLSWFIQSGGSGYKMDIPFDTIVKTEFVNMSPSQGLATFVLSQPPLFFLEGVVASPSTLRHREWRECSDWTEGRQATAVLHHALLGSAVHLVHILRNLLGNGNVALSSSTGAVMLENMFPSPSTSSGMIHPHGLAVAGRGHRKGASLSNLDQYTVSLAHRNSRAVTQSAPPSHAVPQSQSQQYLLPIVGQPHISPTSTTYMSSTGPNSPSDSSDMGAAFQNYGAVQNYSTVLAGPHDHHYAASGPQFYQDERRHSAGMVSTQYGEDGCDVGKMLSDGHYSRTRFAGDMSGHRNKHMDHLSANAMPTRLPSMLYGELDGVYDIRPS